MDLRFATLYVSDRKNCHITTIPLSYRSALLILEIYSWKAKFQFSLFTRWLPRQIWIKNKFEIQFTWNNVKSFNTCMELNFFKPRHICILKQGFQPHCDNISNQVVKLVKFTSWTKSPQSFKFLKKKNCHGNFKKTKQKTKIWIFFTLASTR